MIFGFILGVYHWIIGEVEPYKGKRSLKANIVFLATMVVWAHILPFMMILLAIGTLASPPHKVFDFWRDFEDVKRRWYEG